MVKSELNKIVDVLVLDHLIFKTPVRARFKMSPVIHMPVMIPARVTSISIMMKNLDEIELSDEDLDAYAEELNSINESYITDGGFTSISLKERTPISVFRTFFIEEIFNLIIHQRIRRKPGTGRM